MAPNCSADLACAPNVALLGSSDIQAIRRAERQRNNEPWTCPKFRIQVTNAQCLASHAARNDRRCIECSIPNILPKTDPTAAVALRVLEAAQPKPKSEEKKTVAKPKPKICPTCDKECKALYGKKKECWRCYNGEPVQGASEEKETGLVNVDHIVQPDKMVSPVPDEVEKSKTAPHSAMVPVQDRVAKIVKTLPAEALSKSLTSDELENLLRGPVQKVRDNAIKRELDATLAPDSSEPLWEDFTPVGSAPLPERFTASIQKRDRLTLSVPLVKQLGWKSGQAVDIRTSPDLKSLAFKISESYVRRTNYTLTSSARSLSLALSCNTPLRIVKASTGRFYVTITTWGFILHLDQPIDYSQDNSSATPGSKGRD